MGENERRSFSDAPEIRRSLPDPEPMPSATELVEAAQAAAAQGHARADAAESGLLEAYEDLLDEAAYGDFESAGDPATTADHLLGAGGGPRLEAFVEEWALRDPATAWTWTTDRESRYAQAEVQRQHAEVQSLQADDWQRRAEIAADFHARHNKDVASAAIADAGPSAQIATEDLAAALEREYETVQEIERATADARRELEIRQSVRVPGNLGLQGLDPKTGGPRFAPIDTEPTTEEVGAYMRPAKDEAASEQKLEDFRAAFATEARPKFGPGSRPQ